MDIFAGGFSLFGALGSLLATVATWAATRYVIPWLHIGKRQRHAELIATLADEITDDLRLRYPDKQWLGRLDEAVDTLAALLGIDTTIARRAVQAAAARKG